MMRIPRKLHAWLRQHSLKLLAIRDTPNAIAGGVAIGIFFGFTPLFGFKTLLSLFFAWLTGCNLIAAVIAVTLHDVILPFMPMIYRWEYDIGYWLLSQPHAWPVSLRQIRLDLHTWRSWTTFFKIGKPLLIGSAVCGSPIAVLVFVLTREFVTRHHKKRLRSSELPSAVES
jgi:uncharacterized protein (DUF2062 family)